MCTRVYIYIYINYMSHLGLQSSIASFTKLELSPWRTIGEPTTPGTIAYLRVGVGDLSFGIPTCDRLRSMGDRRISCLMRILDSGIISATVHMNMVCVYIYIYSIYDIL